MKPYSGPPMTLGAVAVAPFEGPARVTQPLQSENIEDSLRMEDAPPPDANDLRAKVFRDREYRGDWRVEKMDEDGGYEVAVFSGGDARARAIRYAGVAASSSTATECELASIIGRSGC
jgi:hypothetical protein